MFKFKIHLQHTKMQDLLIILHLDNITLPLQIIINNEQTPLATHLQKLT